MLKQLKTGEAIALFPEFDGMLFQHQLPATRARQIDCRSFDGLYGSEAGIGTLAQNQGTRDPAAAPIITG